MTASRMSNRMDSRCESSEVRVLQQRRLAMPRVTGAASILIDSVQRRPNILMRRLFDCCNIYNSQCKIIDILINDPVRYLNRNKRLKS